MRRILTALFLAALCGCWTPGSVEEVLPKHTEKFPAGSSFFVVKTERRVEAALKRALRARGFEVKENKDEADLVMTAKVLGWTYNDAGFSGFHARDDMELVITVADRKTKLVRARSNVSVRSDFRIFEKYVKTL
ncbi:MAG: hypothetical protein IJJ84_05160 [Kiritimatiellae bacterium]|nr:hypothetical protein [Kiritimatiellia bacterium]